MNPQSTYTFVQSLAGTHKNYVVGQARVYPGDMLHIQIAGPSVNRSYGLAFDVPLTAEMKAMFKDASGKVASIKSLATSKPYTVVQLRTYDRPTLHFQISDGKQNRPYGLAFDVDSEKWWDTIEGLLGKPNSTGSDEFKATKTPTPVAVAKPKTLEINADEYKLVIVKFNVGKDSVQIEDGGVAVYLDGVNINVG